MSKSRNSQLALGRLTVSAFVSAMLQMCARDALAAGPTQLPIACIGAGVACGTNTAGTNFASYGAATTSTSGKTLTVNQTTNTATLNWASFNVTADGKVVFQQPSSSSVALNRIYDANPSSIFGSVSANGQIYLINANGILFGSTATVNVAGLVASSLYMTDSTIQNGITSPSNITTVTPANPYANAALQPFLDSNGNVIPSGSVTVQAGAQITAADNGRIILAAPIVENAGTITAPDGQIILAAGQTIYLTPSSSSDLRGLVVQVDGSSGNLAANQAGGTLSAPRGNVSLVGLAVNQDGRISATTTVAANGSITLEAGNTTSASPTVATQGGTLEIGANSITEILPEYSDTTTAVADQTQLQSEINLTGQQVFIHGGTITAPSGLLNVVAATNPSVTSQGANDPNAEIRVDSGTTIDLSGSDAVLPVSYNLLTVQLRGAELENDPTQRGGALQGQTVTVDIRADGGKGTALADLSAEIAAMPQNIAQRTETGGTATFKSEGDVVMGSGVSVNVSGGQTTFTGGQVQTTELIGANGKLYDIGSASSLLTYTGVVNPTFTQSYNEWGVQQVVATPGLSHYESGYVQGANAGTIQIAAPAMSIGASLLGSAVSGPYQRGLSASLGGTLIIGQTPGTLISTSGLADFLSPEIDFTSLVSPVVIPDGTALPTQAAQLSTSYLTSDGFSNIQIYGNSRVTLPSGLSLDMPSGTSLLIEAPRIDVNSSITDLAGSLSFINVATVDSSDSGLPRLGVGIGSGVTLDVSGQWTNDNLQVSSVGTGLTLQNAGSIDVQLNTTGSALTLGNQVSLKADGGAWLESNGTISDGKGGSITLDANPAQAAVQIGQGDDIEGFGVGTASGGSFSLTAPYIQISQGTGTAWTSAQAVDELSNPGSVLNVYAPLFSDYGFSSISLTATGAATGTNSDVLTLASGTTIDALTRTWELDPGYQNQVTGGELAGFVQTVTLPEYSRPVADVSLNVLRETPLTLTVANVTTSLGDRDVSLGSTGMGSLDIQAGSSIVTDPGAKINLQSVGSMNIAGTLRAPGGDISATLAVLTDARLDPGYQADQNLFIAPTAVLDVSGTSIVKPNAQHLPFGSVLPGGTVTLDAERGYVVVSAGSLVNISGTSAALEVADTTAAGGYDLETVGSAGGTFSISSPESISLLGSLEGTGGVGTAGAAAAGALVVDLTRLNTNIPVSDANGNPLPQFPDSTPLEIELVDSTQGQTPSAGNSNLAILGVQQINASGIDSLTLSAGDQSGTDTGVVSINTSEPLTLGRQLTISSPILSVAPGYNAVLSAPYVQIGSPLESSTLTPTSGVGSLTVNTEQLNLTGIFTLQSMASVTFNSSGDVQLEGTAQSSGDPVGMLMTAGNLTINAERIYPDTNTEFALSSVPTDGSPTTITLGQIGTSPGAPLSAAGQLTVAAPNIEIGGSLYAPFGIINLTATNQLTLDNNSLLSVSGAGLEIPYGETQYQGSQWFYTNPGSGQQFITGTPTKAVNLTAPHITMGKTAEVDLSGGGDLYASEFIPGTGGLTDNLASGAIAGLYAIIPSQRGLAAPYDPMISGSSSQTLTVYLSGYAGLPAGYYSLLPARYGLLPGADLIEIEPSYTSAVGGRIGTLADGTAVVAGYLTSGTTGLYGSTTEYEGFAIYPGSYSQKLASYTISDASTYFSGTSTSSTAVPLPADGGTLNVEVLAALNNSLDLEGKVLTTAAKGGSGAQVNISAPELEVTSSGSSSSGISIAGSVLQSWNAGSITLGGESSRNTSGGTTIEVTANTVTVDTGVNLSADQITLVAQQGIEVQQGATLASTSGAAGTTLGTLPTATAVSLVDSGKNSLPEAALLSVSDIGLAEVTRTGATATGGATITLDSGSTLKSGGALAFDTPGQITTTGANVNGSGASWSLSSSSVAFVNSGAALPNADADTLNIDSGLLSSMQQAGAIRIASASSIDFYAPVSLGATSSSSAPTLSSLTLIGSTINNQMGAGNVVLGASSVILQGVSASAAAAPTDGTAGNLTLVANTLQVGPGAVTVNNFANTVAQVGGAFEGYETGSLNVGGNLQINAVELTAIPGAPLATSSLEGGQANTTLSSDTQYISNTTIASTGALTIGAPTQLAAGTTLPTALGGSLSLEGTSIEDDGSIVAPSGIVNLTATAGNIHLASGGSINVGGQTVAVVDQTTSSSGGMVTLAANTAGSSITLDAGSTITVSGSGSAPAGSLSITGAGAVDLSGTLNGQAGSGGGTGGSIEVNAGTLTNTLTSLATTLTSGGFTNAINVEVGSGDLDLAYGTNLTANNVVLSADTGKVDIAGNITADSGAQRGFIGLYGGTNVTLEATGQLHADGSGSAGRGGEIDISSTCGTCSVTLVSGSQITAQGQGQMGELVLQAPLQGTSVAINGGSSSVDLPSIVGNNVGQVIIEPTTTFNESSADNIFTDVATAEGNVTGAASSILSSLQASGSNYYVQTGVIINSAADLTLSGINDLYQYSSQNVQGSVVDLTVRTSGNLGISGTVSDGYTTGQGGLAIAGSTASGTLSFVAGANTNSADPLATLVTSSAGLTLNNSAIVRTGTGDLNLVAAGDVTFNKGASAYTTGIEADGVNPLAVKNGATNYLLSYATGGGNVLVQAGRDVVAYAPTGKGNYSVTGWQVHLGSTSTQTPAQYGIDLAGFDWNVGALGGGDVTVAAKGNITELSAATADSRTTNGALYGTGGGLSMTAGGDIGSVQVYVSSGKGTVTAGGGLTAPLTYSSSGATYNVGSTFALGDAEIAVWARNSVLVDAVYNPTALEETSTQSQALYGNYFTYSNDSSLSLQSTTGDVGFEVQPQQVMPGILGVTSTTPSAVTVNQADFLDDLPPNLTIQALQGDINFNLANDTYLYPTSTGQLSLLAGRDITSIGGHGLFMADNLASTLPTAAATTSGNVITPGQLVAAVPHYGSGAAALYAAEGDIHAGDTTPALITAGEDIDNLSVSIPKAAEVVAGRDIVDLTYVGQNANSSDITLISAGRDIVTPLTANQFGISLGGQGALDVFAGRNIDLGFSNGIVTTGSFYDPNLPSSEGADLTVMAGLGSAQGADDANFLSTIVAPSSTYQSELISYVESENGQTGLTFADAETDFQGFSQPLQQALINKVFFNELLLSGREANAGTGVGFTRGYAAIDALFPNSRTGETETNTGSYTGPYSGDIDLIYSQIYTQSGGNINILAPGGQINVGLAVPPLNVGNKSASQLGIVAEGAGNVDIYSLGSVNVNAARIFTLGGGNILIWSDLGNIDAGNGSKASLSIPPPTIQYTATGQVIFNYSGAVAGSGIRTIQTEPDQAAGSVDLDAPVGTVDAGDAGIGAAGNINIAAQHVIGANNINFGGTATGVPPEVSSLGASLSGATAAATSSATTAESKAQDQASTQQAAAPLAQTALSWLDVFVTGVGEENCKPEDTECLSRQKAPQ